eukprot:TRINITY_DN16154_c0_g1_i1.p1 TRINITY_DN16154_c0_g1~~TRINITY_DN16154_c0_g1_i1.p1  ORF type:complete len:231 (+),score=45.95 TRINITY_DN16154_c0_g1_i1:60-695(+)
MQVEVCVDSLEGAAAAAAGGADRIEVCSALAAGGLTPSVGLLTGVAAASASAATRAGRPAPGLFVMLRHRAGDFCYDGPDLETMVADVRGCLAACPHVSGFVFGALTPEGDVDEPATRAVVAAASPLPVTFHRAIDWTRDAVLAVEAAARCGCRTILSSGLVRKGGRRAAAPSGSFLRGRERSPHPTGNGGSGRQPDRDYGRGRSERWQRG